ncbi:MULTISPECIES: tetratricopeptide repeat protein [unclassified Caballeronia]|uniref:tetratricopeptide repeat protein n=1 Tax=unclassified Caballeronia TaxID=2646786 RepID=UPI0020288F84|nr:MULTISPECIES: tetratricopeptide repeat protein [unclassified Caballeronia]
MTAQNPAADPLQVTLLQTAAQLHANGQGEQAKSHYRRALELDPNNASAHNDFAVTVGQLGETELALHHFSLAVELDGRCKQAHSNKISALKALGRTSEAVAAARQAIAALGDDVSHYQRLVDLLLASDQMAEATRVLKHAISLFPEELELKLQLAESLVELGRPAESFEIATACAHANPNNSRAQVLLARNFQYEGDYRKAIRCLKTVASLRPDDVEIQMHLGNMSVGIGDLNAAHSYFNEGLRLQFNHAPCHFGLSVCYLMQEQWRAGWEEFEHRWKGAVMQKKPDFPADQEWRGQDLTDKHLVLIQEQGAGDAIQFFRYLRYLPSSVGRVTFITQKSLLKLLQSSPLLKTLKYSLEIVDSYPNEKISEADYWLPFLSLPARLLLDTETSENPGPYLAVDTEEPLCVTFDKRRLFKAKRPRIGFAWKGNPQLSSNRWRSTALREWTPLLERTDIQWISLQQGDLTREERDIIAHYQIKALPPVNDWYETATVIDALDLVIAVDTGVAHLAGAMTKPTWMLNRASSEWRWGVKRTDTVWYSSMRIFNQEQLGDWSAVIQAVDHELGTCKQRTAPFTPTKSQEALYAAERLLNQARQSSEKKDHLHARELCYSAHVIAPDFLAATYELGLLHGRLGEHDDALKCFLAVASRDEHYLKVQKNCGLAYENLGKMQEAVKAYQRALAQEPDDVQVSVWISELQALLAKESSVGSAPIHERV